MGKKELVKLYYKKTSESVEVVRVLSGTLDDIRRLSLQFDHENVSKHNEQATSLSDQLRNLHAERQSLAQQLGCQSPRFATELVHLLQGNAHLTLKKVTDELHELILECKNKTERHSHLVIQQQQVLGEATETLRVQVNA